MKTPPVFAAPAPTPSRPRANLTDVTLTGTDPLEIQADGDANPSPFEPRTLVNPAFLTVGDRVTVDFSANPPLIIGRAGGIPSPDSDATAGTLVYRDGSGDFLVNEPPANDANPAPKSYVDNEIVAAIAAERALPVQGVIPSSVDVTGAGSSASVAADGTVTFTDVTSVSLNDVDDGTGADQIEYIVSIESPNSDSIVTRLRAGGTDVAAAGSYYYAGTYSYLDSGPSRSATTSATECAFWCATSSGTLRKIHGTLLVTSAGVSGSESLFLLNSGVDTGANFLQWLQGGGCMNTGAQDGITILSASAFSGTIKAVKKA